MKHSGAEALSGARTHTRDIVGGSARHSLTHMPSIESPIVIWPAQRQKAAPRVAYVIGLLMYSRSLFVAPTICNVYHVLACQSHLAAADKLQGRTFRINQRNASERARD